MKTEITNILDIELCDRFHLRNNDDDIIDLKATIEWDSNIVKRNDFAEIEITIKKVNLNGYFFDVDVLENYEIDEDYTKANVDFSTGQDSEFPNGQIIVESINFNITDNQINVNFK